MKRSLVLLAALALCAATPALAARGDTWIGIQLGGSMPTGEFRKRVTGGFEGGLVGTYMKSERAGFGVDVAYHIWGGTPFDVNTNSLLLTIDAIQVTPHALYDSDHGGKIRSYFKSGCGLYRVKTSRVYLPSLRTADDAQTRFGFNVGVGVHFNHRPANDIGVAGMYHIVQTSGYALQVFTVAVSLSWTRRAR